MCRYPGVSRASGARRSSTAPIGALKRTADSGQGAGPGAGVGIQGGLSLPPPSPTPSLLSLSLSPSSLSPSLPPLSLSLSLSLAPSRSLSSLPPVPPARPLPLPRPPSLAHRETLPVQVSGTIEGILQEVVLGNKDMINLKDINTTPGFYKVPGA